MAGEERAGTSILFGVIAGLAMGCIGGAGGAWVIRTKMVASYADWQLTPVVVAAADIPDDAVVTYDLSSQRAIPKRFFTPSMVPPAAISNVVDHTIHAPLKAGEPLLWSELDDARCDEALEALAKAKPGSKELAAWLSRARAEQQRNRPGGLTSGR